jgi:hypothetical protein
MTKTNFQTDMDFEWFRVSMPYYMAQLETDDGYLFLPVNREYKPLGVVADAFVDYDAHRDRALRFKSNPLNDETLWCSTHRSDLGYLYDDRSIDTYLERLSRLVALSTNSEILKGVLGGRPSLTAVVSSRLIDSKGVQS